jgi:hypothetical protein
MRLKVDSESASRVAYHSGVFEFWFHTSDDIASLDAGILALQTFLLFLAAILT